MPSNIRLGVVGLGNIGRQHVANILNGDVARAELSAVCSRTLPAFLEEDDRLSGVPHFTTASAMFTSGNVDAVLIATPTMDHAETGIAALKSGIHVMMEKPLARSVVEAQTLLAAHRSDDTVFALMLNQRRHPAVTAMRRLLDAGSLGTIQRVNWTMTHWYRPDVYYQVSPWRGTWIGEGGGALLNQCIHNLDILQWFIGMPEFVTASCGFGKHHEIEVEDEVSALLEFPGAGGTLVPAETAETRHAGASGTIIASTGEAPGVNQLDIVGDRGMLRYDGDEIVLLKNDPATSHHCRTTLEMFGTPYATREVVKPDPPVNQHAALLQNFADAILDAVPLIAPAHEGLRSLEFANALLLSAWTKERIKLPIDAGRYESLLQERMKRSGLRTTRDLDVTVNMNKSYR